MTFIRNTTTIKKAAAIVVEEKHHSIANSVVEVKATAALSKEVNKELKAEAKEIDMEELLDAQADRGNA